MRSIYLILSLIAFNLLSLQAQDRVWPGDANNNGIVNEVDVLYWGKAFGSTGAARMPADSNFIGYRLPTPLWNQNFWNGLNYAYADANGDGIVDDLDIRQSYLRNFGRIHGPIMGTDDFPASAPGNIPIFRVNSAATQVSGNETIEFFIELGDEEVAVENFYGISFRIFYDTTFIQQGLSLEFVEGNWIEKDNPEDVELFVVDNKEEGFAQVAITRKDQQPINGAGTILRGIVVIEDIIFRETNDTLLIDLDSVRLVTPTLQSIKAESSDLVLKKVVTSTIQPELAGEHLDVYPNPAQEEINFLLKDDNNEIEYIQVINMLGQPIQKVTLPPLSTSYTMNTNVIGSGIFLITTKTKHKIYTSKVFIN